MLTNLSLGHSSGSPEQLKCQQRFLLGSSRTMAVLVILFCIWPCTAHAQSPENSISAYADAIKQSTIAERITAMEHYLSIAGSSRLKVDALEFLVWDHLRLSHQSQSMQRAKELLTLSPGNPIAIAVLNQDASSQPQDKYVIQDRLAALNTAMNALSQLNKPEGMLDRNFQMLKQQVGIMLNGAIGMSYLAVEDYPQARLALQQAVASDPNNSQWVYGMGLALLNGKNRDQYRGYWYLARAANLSGGTPQGQAIADYARKAYQKDGGKDAGWERYVASAAALDAPPSPDSGTAKPSSGSVTAASNNVPSAARPSTSSSGASPSRNTTTIAGSSPAAKSSDVPRHKTKGKEPGFEDTLGEPPSHDVAVSAPAPNRPKVIAAPSEAVSLGILIETSLLTNRNREAIIGTLQDIIRNLRVNDEACILVFSDELDFEQDLTADDKLLEEAINQIRPKQGKALLSGIAFAAGHLKRIGKNSNRILLVISDGRTTQATEDTITFRSQVSGVRIDCLGFQAEGEGRALLERVAAYSGGKASFATDSGEFRTAALQITRGMGIAMP